MVDRIVVTGAAGTIGHAVVNLLVRRSFDVVALIRPDEQLDSPATVLAGDCRDESFVAAAMRDADAVIHLAAIPSPGAHPPAEVFENNTVSTFVVLDQAGLAGVDRALVASSLSALGFPWSPTATSPQYTPVDTQHPLVPADPYGLSKVVDECTAEMMHRRHGIHALLYRFPHVTSQPELERLATAWAVDPAAGATTLWSYLETRDAVAALAAGLDCPLVGVQRIMLAAPTTVMSNTTTSLMARFHPNTQIRSHLSGRDTPIDAEPANQMLGIRPAHVHPFTSMDNARHNATPLWAAEHDVAEGPFWDTHRATVSWVDITGGELWQSQLNPWEPSVIRFDGTLGAAIPRRMGGFVLCLNGEIVLTDPIGAVVSRTTVLTDATLRFNDAKCDSAGRLWAGTTAIDFTEGRGALYRHDGTTNELVAEGLVLPNGLGWSPDDTRFYLVDSMRNQILHANFDAQSGTIGELSVAFTTTGGLPDGLCVDSTGMLWVAFWGDGVVLQFTPEGRQLASIEVPAQQCSSCCIVNDTLFITTARSGLSTEEIAAEPLAGSLFTAVVEGLQGVPLHRAAF